MAFPVEVRSLFTSLSSSREVCGAVEVPDVGLGEQVFHFEGPVEFCVTLTNVGAGIVAEGTATAEARTSCARCLCEMTLTVATDVDGFYVLPGHDTEIPEEQEYELVADNMTVDLEPAVAQSLLVDLPFAPVHDEDCKGICPVCGVDRNLVDCDCDLPVPPSPFEALKNLDLPDGSRS
jgi:uncharacterized protein